MKYRAPFCWLTALATSTTVTNAAVLSRDAIAGVATIDVSKTTGAATFLGSGFIYGFPDNGSDADNSIPDHYLQEIKFRTCRGGGAQISSEGWATGGLDGYKGRLASALSNYRTTRKYGGDYLLMPSDLWGAQGGAPEGFPFPGDGGDWSEMEKFLRQLIFDIKDNNMLDGLVIDLWNEPDLDIFWNREWSQYIEYFIRGSNLLREEFPEVRISGPSMAHSPHLDNDKWRAWMSAIASNGAVPDIYSWHQIGAWEREPDTTIPAFRELREVYSLPDRPIDVNEYSWPDEQNPANSAYYLAQLERHNIRGLRANWGGGPTLHDLMANLVWKNDQGYQPNGEWHLYKYYGSMEGGRVQTLASADLKFDVFAVRSDSTLKILAGSRTVQSRYDIALTGLHEIGLPEQGALAVRRLQFDWAGSAGYIHDILDLGSYTYQYSENQLRIPYDPPTNSTAFAFEIELP